MELKEKTMKTYNLTPMHKDILTLLNTGLKPVLCTHEIARRICNNKFISSSSSHYKYIARQLKWLYDKGIIGTYKTRNDRVYFSLKRVH